ncbi:MAG TPA: FAD binding domain-containing protein [Terriglobales bacterium]|nr:FAD binding domain-containing protein [Terriglobales bacterium]
MRAFEYTSPTTKEQAVQLLGSSWSQAEAMAGGTDLLALMKDDVVAPKRVVNLKAIQGMDAIAYTPRAGLKVGALVKLQAFADNADVRKNYPVLANAADDAASPQIRNMASIGGNLCQRPRCWYFRGGFGLLGQDESGKSLVEAGENRYHAILGNDGPAKFVSPSTLAPALITHGASIRIFGPSGAREVPLEKFYVIPKTAADREHDLKPNEIVTEIVIPPPDGMVKSAQYEIRQKQAFDWPLALASVVLKMNGDTIQSARVVLGSVAPVPWVSTEAAQALAGKKLDAAAAEAAGAAAVQNARSLAHNAYKIQLTRVAVRRAVLAAAKGGQA